MININLKNDKIDIKGDVPEVTTELSFLISCLYVRLKKEGYKEEVIDNYIVTIVKNSLDYVKREGYNNDIE